MTTLATLATLIAITALLVCVPLLRGDHAETEL